MEFPSSILRKGKRSLEKPGRTWGKCEKKGKKSHQDTISGEYRQPDAARKLECKLALRVCPEPRQVSWPFMLPHHLSLKGPDVQHKCGRGSGNKAKSRYFQLSAGVAVVASGQ